jgi:DNA topoisomerase I
MTAEIPDAPSLRYSSDESPGIERRRRGQGFAYFHPDGRKVKEAAVLERIRKLAIPPAYAKVWICSDPNGHLQATGMDARGRKQYRYHPDWRAVRDADKFARMPEFARALTRIRKRVSQDLKREGLARERVLAAVVRLLDLTLIRIGNEQYARDNGSYGLTTLRTRHVRLRGKTIRLEFRGKSGILHVFSVTDPEAANVVKGCIDLPGQELFQYIDDLGERRVVSSSDVNEYLREASGQDFSAKDFRTWYATSVALETLLTLDFETQREAKAHIKETLCRIAERLGNTPTMCRKSYVHPAVLEAFLQGRLKLPGRNCRSGRERLLQLLRHVSKAPDTRARIPVHLGTGPRAVPPHLARRRNSRGEAVWR